MGILTSFGVIFPPRLSLINGLGHFIRAIYREYVGMDTPHTPCPSVCPCREQEYILSEGSKVDIEKGKDVDIELAPEPSPFKDCGTLRGRVFDMCGHPLKNALIKVFDLNHHPIAYTFTNKDGEYLLCLPSGDYWVYAD